MAQQQQDSRDRSTAIGPERIAQACAIALVALILVGTLMTGSSKQSVLSPFPPYLHVDKLGHVIGFFGLGFAFVRSRMARVRPWHVLAFAFALGALTEFCQGFIPGRTAKLSDMLIDVAGAFAGVYFGCAALSRSPAAGRRSD